MAEFKFIDFISQNATITSEHEVIVGEGYKVLFSKNYIDHIVDDQSIRFIFRAFSPNNDGIQMAIRPNMVDDAGQLVNLAYYAKVGLILSSNNVYVLESGSQKWSRPIAPNNEIRVQIIKTGGVYTLYYLWRADDQSPEELMYQSLMTEEEIKALFPIRWLVFTAGTATTYPILDNFSFEQSTSEENVIRDANTSQIKKLSSLPNTKKLRIEAAGIISSTPQESGGGGGGGDCDDNYPTIGQLFPRGDN